MAGPGGAVFEVVPHVGRPGEWCVLGRGAFAGQSALFWGPKAEERARAYAQWLNAGAAHQRRKTDPGYGR